MPQLKRISVTKNILQALRVKDGLKPLFVKKKKKKKERKRKNVSIEIIANGNIGYVKEDCITLLLWATCNECSSSHNFKRHLSF